MNNETIIIEYSNNLLVMLWNKEKVLNCEKVRNLQFSI